jgi:NTE family protein
MYQINSIKNNEFNLVLSGGGALGYAHIGVINKLYDNNLFPEEIIGTSMGAIVGAVLSLKLPKDEFNDIFEEFSDVRKWFKISLNNSAIIDNIYIYKMFDFIFKNKKIKDLEIDLKIVSTNFNTGEAFVFDKNSDIYVKDALLASMAIPGIFPQFKINNISYVDGFIVDNMPINQVSNKDLLTVSINVLNEKSIKNIEDISYNIFTNIFAIFTSFERTIRLINITQTRRNITQYNLNKNNGLIIIEPDLTGYKTSSFKKYDDIVQIGYNSFEN